MAETTSYRKRVAKPRGQAVQSPVTKQQPDDDSPSKRQCLTDIVNETASLTSTEVKQQKISSKAKEKAGLRGGHPLAESSNSSHSRNQFARDEGSTDVKEEKEARIRGLVGNSPLTPTRTAPRPPFSRNALPYASLPVAPPKPPRTYEQSPSSSLYPSLSPILGDRTCSETSQKKTVIPVPAPRGRTKAEPVQQKETAKIPDVASQRWEKRKNAKENFPLVAHNALPEEPTKKPVLARLLEWQRKVEETGAEVPAFFQMASERQGFRAERSRKALSSALEERTGPCPALEERTAPCPAPRSGTRSGSSDRLFCDVRETQDGNGTKDDVHVVGSSYENIKVVQVGPKERFYRKQKNPIAVDSKAAETPQKKRNAPLPPSTNTVNNRERKPKGSHLCLDIRDASSASTHEYFILEEPECHVQKQPETSSGTEALPRMPVGCSSDIYGESGSVEPDERLDESSSDRLVPDCLASLTEFSRSASVCGNSSRAKGQPEGSSYSLAGAFGGEDDDEGNDNDDENIYCEIESPVSVHGSRKTEACDENKSKILQATYTDQDDAMKQRPMLSLESKCLSPSKPERPKVPMMTPTSPGHHRLVWPRKAAAPTITISHQMRGCSSRDAEDKADDADDLPFIPDPSVKQQLQVLQDLVYQELSVIHQTSNALAQCCHDLSAFSGSAEALECHRIILMACKKREAYVMEMQRLRDARSSTHDSGPRGILTISNIRLPLKPEFMSKIGTTFDTSIHHFVVLIRHGCNVLFTQMLSTHRAMVRSSLDFPDTFEIKDIRQNSFIVDVEVYGMSIERTPGAYSSKKKKKALNPMKALTPSCTRRPLSPGSLRSVRTSNFINIASLRLDALHLSKMNFSLERIPFSSPLQGSIHAELGCQMESQIEERGFLTMFEDRCGFGTWYRRWCVLKCNRLLYWKYPGEEHEKDPIGFVDLKQCVSDRVDLVSRSYCARPNTFEMLVLKGPQTNQNDESIMHEGRHEPDSFIKLWFSSDTKEERLNWCSQLNEALVNLRAWHNDAARPDSSWRQDRDDVQPD